MRDAQEPARRPVAGLGSPFLWVLLAVLAAGVLLAALQHDAGPWLVAMAAASATFVAVVGLVGARADDRAATPAELHRQGGWAALRTELARSRRHDRHFAIVGIPDGVWSLASTDAATQPDFAAAVAESVQSLIRRPDVAWVDGPMLHVMLTDCDRSQGLAFLDRARAAMPQVFADDRVNLVVFPDDGITLGALVSQLHADGSEPSAEAVAE
jgi:hypothetical protein